MALGAALEPKQNPNGTWVFNTALIALHLECAAPVPPTGVERLYHHECLTSYGLCFFAADNDIGDEGAVAQGAALEPKQDPDGTWVFNPALSTLDLTSAGPCISLLVHPQG